MVLGAIILINIGFAFDACDTTTLTTNYNTYKTEIKRVVDKYYDEEYRSLVVFACEEWTHRELTLRKPGRTTTPKQPTLQKNATTKRQNQHNKNHQATK